MEQITRISRLHDQMQAMTAELETLKSELSQATQSLQENTSPAQDGFAAMAAYLSLAGDRQGDELLQMILRCAMHVVNAGGAGLTLLDPEKNKLVFRAAVGDGAEGIIGYEVPLEGSQHGLAFATGEIQSSTPLHSGAADAAQVQFKNVLVAPLFVGEEGVGTMSAVNKKDGAHFSPQDMAAYGLFAELAAMVVRQRLREEAVEQALAGAAPTGLPPELAAVASLGSDGELLRLARDLVAALHGNERLIPLAAQFISLLGKTAGRIF